MTEEEKLQKLGEVFGTEDMRHYPILDELVARFLKETDRISALQSDPNVVLEILNEIDDIVYHRLRPALWDRIIGGERVSEGRKTARTKKLESEQVPSTITVPNSLPLREVFSTVIGETDAYSTPTVYTGKSDLDMDSLKNAYETVPGLMDTLVKLVLVEGGLEVVTEDTDRTLFKFNFGYD